MPASCWLRAIVVAKFYNFVRISLSRPKYALISVGGPWTSGDETAPGCSFVYESVRTRTETVPWQRSRRRAHGSPISRIQLDAVPAFVPLRRFSRAAGSPWTSLSIKLIRCILGLPSPRIVGGPEQLANLIHEDAQTTKGQGNGQSGAISLVPSSNFPHAFTTCIAAPLPTLLSR